MGSHANKFLLLARGLVVVGDIVDVLELVLGDVFPHRLLLDAAQGVKRRFREAA